MVDTEAIRLQFRDAMASLPAGVNVITSDGEAGLCGITASAVCSVTDTPPTLLLCINQQARAHDVLAKNGRLAVNMLSGTCQGTAMVFAGAQGGSIEERFATCDWRMGDTGVPVLSSAVAALEGVIEECKQVGTHSVFFVRIERITLQPDRDGLVYFARAFHSLARVAAHTP
ncbi:FMN reductase [Robbsia andropogonis]|uniref:FMN reductase n=1 Tax=Robbsia andropogonis TaxID=28092 RepID=A0A0F5K079_9BURK|nr:flavin reductase [Robbsia andropogonis]KKB63511.1 FMN reductase [Robbsia andropogonis]MCP1116858.1 flavin reductase [Robbsia andropogonis]MCP1126463.1 flavin reductase [Robbsia andropogonis]